MIVAGTGHRPEGCLHSETEVRIMVRNKLKSSGATHFITGMAHGFDLWAGDEARLLGLELWCARPWATHPIGHYKPTEEEAKLYQTLLDYATKVEVIVDSDKYPGVFAFFKRNEWMVDNADVVMSYLDPSLTKGGTYGCVEYARKKGKKIANIIQDPPF